MADADRIRDNPKSAAAQKSLGMVYAAQQKFEATKLVPPGV
jgi:hypothetical protein